MYGLLRFVPRNLFSSLFGWVANRRLPRPLNEGVLRAFASFYKIDLSECDRPLTGFPSLGEFFTRPLKEGSRPVGDGVVSPVDGVVIEHGPIEEGRLLQVKGRTYSVHRLLTQAVDSERYRDGYFATIYLAPHNYHRIHSPVDGEVREAVLVPGTLWPVNSWSVNNIDGLFTVNERVITQIATSTGEVSVVAVGAFNVGSISVTFDPELRSNSHVRSITRRCYSPARAVKKGEHIGTFHLGSTVVLLFDRQTVAAGALVGIERGEVRMGQSLTTGNTASLKSAEG